MLVILFQLAVVSPPVQTAQVLANNTVDNVPVSQDTEVADVSIV